MVYDETFVHGETFQHDSSFCTTGDTMDDGPWPAIDERIAMHVYEVELVEPVTKANKIEVSATSTLICTWVYMQLKYIEIVFLVLLSGRE